MNDKLAIIMSGGGMKASFGVGVILALVEEYNIREPFLFICASGSAGTGSYYITKQYNSIRNIWINLVSSKQFINNWRFWKILDIDYLIDIIFLKQDPLEENKIYKSKTKYLIPAWNKSTGEIDYFDNHKDMDVFENMRATKVMPIVFRLNPRIRVNDSVYCDSLLSSISSIHIKKAVECGANKILLIDSISPFRKSYYHYLFSLWMYFQKCKKTYYQTKRELLSYQVPENIEIFTISPKSKLKITTLNNKKELLQEAIDQGYKETISNDKLKLFLE